MENRRRLEMTYARGRPLDVVEFDLHSRPIELDGVFRIVKNYQSTAARPRPGVCFAERNVGGPQWARGDDPGGNQC